MAVSDILCTYIGFSSFTYIKMQFWSVRKWTLTLLCVKSNGYGVCWTSAGMEMISNSIAFLKLILLSQRHFIVRVISPKMFSCFSLACFCIFCLRLIKILIWNQAWHFFNRMLKIISLAIGIKKQHRLQDVRRS